jgi:glutaredoxin
MEFIAKYLLATLLLLSLFSIIQTRANQDTSKIEPQVIELYVSKGCPHCEAAQIFIAGLARERSDIQINLIEIQGDPQALERLQALSRAAGVAQPGVPTIRIGGKLIVGFDSVGTSGKRIRELLDKTVDADKTDLGTECGIEAKLTCEAPAEDAIEIPFTGQKITVDTVGLPLFTIMIGLLDGFNPCSMWVLILMVSMLASLRDRKKMLAIAGTFIAIEGIAYFAFMAAWLNLFIFIGLSRASEITIGLFAIAAAMVNFKDFLAFGRGITLSIPAAAKPGIYARLRTILHADRMWPALVGTAALAFLVQLVELLCTSGFPALYTRILTLHRLDNATYYGYLMLYNAMYMLDDIIVLGIGVATLSQRRLQEKEGRVLKLIAAITMLGLGIYLLVH